MTRYLLITLLIFIFLSCRKSPSQVPETYSPCANSLPSAGDFLPASEFMHIADKYVTAGLPGITFMARKGNQYWHYNAGSYNTEAKLPMKSCIIWQWKSAVVPLMPSPQPQAIISKPKEDLDLLKAGLAPLMNIHFT